jgi:putative ABC transport system permease protein
MALFTVGTGLLVVAGAILTGRYQRVQESVLLRTLGASSRQIIQILLAEYVCLGAMAALTGVMLSVGAAWALARFAFSVTFAWPVLPLCLAFVSVVALTVVTGLLSSRGVVRQPPLAVLRAEASAA